MNRLLFRYYLYIKYSLDINIYSVNIETNNALIIAAKIIIVLSKDFFSSPQNNDNVQYDKISCISRFFIDINDLKETNNALIIGVVETPRHLKTETSRFDKSCKRFDRIISITVNCKHLASFYHCKNWQTARHYFRQTSRLYRGYLF